jgi:hypothetical protein
MRGDRCGRHKLYSQDELRERHRRQAREYWRRNFKGGSNVSDDELERGLSEYYDRIASDGQRSKSRIR